jgi:glycosyltransferase involved in cell wall biosynthesis
MLVTRDQRRGPESFAVTLAGELVDRGMSVSLRSLAPHDSGPRLGVEPLGLRPLGVRTLFRLRREISASDVVVACGSKTLPACALAGAATSPPVIYQNIGDPLYWAGHWSRRARVRILLRRTAAVAALTERSASDLQSSFGVPPSRIAVIRNARSSACFRPATTEERRSAREQLGQSQAGHLVALVGALSPEKRIDLAIDAVAQMRSELQLLVVGSGPLEQELRAHAAKVARGRVSFLGTRGEMQTVYWASDAVLLTSASEGVPGVLIEASLCGLPAVSTDVGLVRDIVVPGETGLLVDSIDPGAIADALEHVLARRHELGTRARAHAMEKFTLDVVVDRWVDLIRSVLDREGSRVPVSN